MKIRLARVEDAPAISIVHIDSWRTSYRGIVPDRVLDSLDYVRNNMRWREMLSNLGLAYRNSGLMEDAIKWFVKATTHKEPVAGAFTNYASCFVEKGDPERAIELLNTALEMDESIPMSHWNLALALLETGQWERGWKEYEYGMAPGGLRPDRQLGDLPLWDGSAGKRVIVWGEQGIGDEIMFASMLPDMLKTNEVIFDCHPRLVKLFEHSFGIKCYGTRKVPETPWLTGEQADARVAIGSLGKFYRNQKADFPGTPYLKADPLLPPSRKLRVGISWTGGRFSDRVATRTVPLSWWSSILNNDCEFVSLQYTDCEKEIEIVEKANGYTIRQFPEVKADDYYETARLVASCDLVISVCTSVVHLAGALGVPCWVMVPRKPAWRYGYKGRNPWYRSVRQYRQPEATDDSWIDVVARVGLDLSDYLAAQRKVA